MPISFVLQAVFMSFRNDGKKKDKADSPSGPYAATVSVATVGSYKLPLGQYMCIGRVVACSVQQGYGPGSNPGVVRVPRPVHGTADATHIALR
jgi:hypothetical protein